MPWYRLPVLTSVLCIINWFLETTSSCMHPSYVYEILTSLPLCSCSLLWAPLAPLATLLGPYNAIFTSPNRCACFVHTQNNRWCLAIKTSHGDPHSSFAVWKSPSNHSKRCYGVFPRAFLVSHHSGNSSVIASRCDSRITKPQNFDYKFT